MSEVYQYDPEFRKVWLVRFTYPSILTLHNLHNFQNFTKYWRPLGHNFEHLKAQIKLIISILLPLLLTYTNPSPLIMNTLF